MSNSDKSDNGDVRLKVWDLPVRVFHWVLVLAIAFLWYSGENADDLERHMQIGSAVLALLCFRIVWGFIGSTTARFTHFIRPFAALGYLSKLKSGQSEPEAGHNPLGGLMVVALLLSVLLQAVSGLYTSDEVFSEGPLYANASSEISDLMGTIHHLNFNVLLGLIALHVCAAFFYLIVKKTNLIRPMITGVMRWPSHVSKPNLAFRSALLGLVIFVVLLVSVRYFVF